MTQHVGVRRLIHGYICASDLFGYCIVSDTLDIMPRIRVRVALTPIKAQYVFFFLLRQHKARCVAEQCGIIFPRNVSAVPVSCDVRGRRRGAELGAL